ncbi:MAG TPA: sialate O-acetylesterase [Opitutaceae bacterium]|nr:sialate O-acetylesterase [Opitutaceae bacterium]
MIPRLHLCLPLVFGCILPAITCGVIATRAAIASPASAPVVNPPAREQFDIYLLMGQSNMAGRDTRKLGEQVDHPHVLALDAKDRWVIARDPIFPQTGRIPPGAGPGIPFAVAMLKARPGVTIGLVPCAVGGTPLRRWVKGGDLYERALHLAAVAARSGVIKGVLWQQGESDTTSEKDAATYETRLAGMLADLRRDLGLPDLPVVVGQIGGFLSAEKYPYVDMVRAAIRRIPADVPGVGYADTAGLGDRGDRLHFSADAQREFGARFARAMLELQTAPVADAAAPAAVETVAVWPEGRMPGQGATAPEHLLPPRGDHVHRLTDISRPTLSVFPAPKGAKPAPAMIVCPGGGYSYVVYDKEGNEIAAWLNSAGITAVVLRYRVPHNRAGALQDLQRSLSLARANAAAWNIDPHRLGVIGFSAGGNLGAKVSTAPERTYAPVDATDEQSCRPDFAVLVYPAYLEHDGRLAPDLPVDGQVPPTLIVHNEDDHAFVAGSKLYHAALVRAGVPNEFLLYRTGGHGYGLRCTLEARAWPHDALIWLHRIGVP